jgi:hypothetical protein
MKSAANRYLSTFSAVMALAGLEHGIGEVLQGSAAPEGLFILSWPDAPFFKVLGGEPALTVIPNLLAAGSLTLLVSLALLVWSLGFAHRKRAGLVVFLLSFALLLVGGGIFPPILGMLLGAACARRPRLGQEALTPLQRSLARLWPAAYRVCLASWLALLPGIPILAYSFGMEHDGLTIAVTLCALGSLALAGAAAFARDRLAQAVRPTREKELRHAAA